MRGLFALAVTAYAVVLGWAWEAFPGRVPTHFGASGAADSWSSRETAWWTFAAIGAGMALLLGGLAAGIGRLPTTWTNLPHKDWWVATAQREERMRSMLAGDLWLFAAGTMGLLAGLLALVIVAADDPKPSLGASGWVLLGGYLLFVGIQTVWTIRWRYRPEEEEG